MIEGVQALEQSMAVSEQTFLQLALEDPNQWELHCGKLRRKPTMTADHNVVASELNFQLKQQVDRSRFDVRLNMGHVYRSGESYYIPDVYVVPIELVRAQRGQTTLEAYQAPLPLVVEVWSPSTGDYDVDTKIPEYRRRGDLEIWRIHPIDRTLIAWRRQSDGMYSESLITAGTISPIALPEVAIELDSLFN